MSVHAENETAFKKGDIIFTEGEKGEIMYLIKSGKVKIYKMSENIQHVLTIIGEGNFFGEMAIIEKKPRSATVEAHTDVILIKFNKEAFISNITQNPFVEYIINELIKRLRKTSNKFKLLAIPDDALRFATMLLNRGEHFESSISNEIIIPAETDVKSLASQCGLKYNDAKNLINNFHESEIIKYNGDVIIVDKSKLSEFIRFKKLRSNIHEDY